MDTEAARATNDTEVKLRAMGMDSLRPPGPFGGGGLKRGRGVIRVILGLFRVIRVIRVT